MDQEQTRDALEKAYLGDSELLDDLLIRKALADLDAKSELERFIPKSRWLTALRSPQYAAAA